MDSTDLPKALIFLTMIGSVTGYTVRHILRLEAANQFPRRIHLGTWRIAWDAAEVAKWQRGEWRPTSQDPATSKA